MAIFEDKCLLRIDQVEPLLSLQNIQNSITPVETGKKVPPLRLVFMSEDTNLADSITT